jgi:transcriptional regulator with XRE-family HTH domain
MRADDLKERRRRLGFTQAQLAEQLGVSRNAIARWEIGMRAIPKMAEKLLECVERETRRRALKKGLEKKRRK